MKNTSGRELKDFVQKTLDDCFRGLEKGEVFTGNFLVHLIRIK